MVESNGAVRGRVAGAARPTRGRQAEAAINDQRLLEAARDVFAAQGYDASVAAVAVAAGIGMGSLYRRYATKDDLLADLCLRSMREMTALASAAAGADPWHRLAGFVRACVAARCGAFAPVAGRIPVSTEMIGEAVRSQDAAKALVAAAQDAGAMRPDVTVVDVLRLIELFSRSRRAASAGEAGSDPGDAGGNAGAEHRLLEIALAGLRAGDTAPLPGPAPTLATYRARWTPP